MGLSFTDLKNMEYIYPDSALLSGTIPEEIVLFDSNIFSGQSVNITTAMTPLN